MADNDKILVLDKLGRIVIPANIRRRYGLKAGSKLSMVINGNTICMTVNEKKCCICSSHAELVLVDADKDGWICEKCKYTIKNLS